MKHHICWMTGVLAVAFVVLGMALIGAGSLMQPGAAMFQVVVTGMYVGIFGTALGAVSFCTYMTPYERAQWREAQARAQRSQTVEAPTTPGSAQ